MLLKSGAGPNLATDDGQTPVHVAAQHGNFVTLQLLLDDGGDPLFKNRVRLENTFNYNILLFYFNLLLVRWEKHHCI